MAGQRLGQHFLIRRSVLNRIAEAACPSSELLVVEIGPGRGGLTEFLLARAERVVAIEVDPSLADRLKQRLCAEPRLTVIQADVLKTSLSQWGPAVIAGNLPYYITSAILEKIFALGPLLRRAVVLVQREVAERLTARPGIRDYGYLTVQANLSTRPQILFEVPPSAFWPPPRVNSAAVLLTPRRTEESLNIQDRSGFLDFVGLCFRHKRKTLRNNLAPSYGSRVDQWPEAGLRAEQLSLEQFIELYGRLNRQ